MYVRKGRTQKVPSTGPSTVKQGLGKLLKLLNQKPKTWSKHPWKLYGHESDFALIVVRSRDYVHSR